MPDIQGVSLVIAIRKKTVSLHSSLHSWYLFMNDGHMHWGIHVECCKSSLLECSPAVQMVVGSIHGRDMSVSGVL